MTLPAEARRITADALTLSMIQKRIALGSAIEPLNGKQPRTYGTGRICRGCLATRLSRYNATAYCSVCHPTPKILRGTVDFKALMESV